jgi:hypothetical protein
MEPLRELLGVDHRQTLEFFYTGLQEHVDPGVDRDELLYNASVLAHHAQVSTHAASDVPTPTNLSEVFDTFVFDQSQTLDGLMLETAGAQCLLLSGFFEDQMRRRHRIEWYASLGAGFYQRAAAFERSHRKARLLASLSRHFELWRETQAQLGRSLRDTPYLLSIEEPE